MVCVELRVNLQKFTAKDHFQKTNFNRAQNNRLEFAKELGKFIAVDIYGSCGTMQCPRTDPECFNMLERDYKFYLSFENSNCRDYITEKLWVNGLSRRILPIVVRKKVSLPLQIIRT